MQLVKYAYVTTQNNAVLSIVTRRSGLVTDTACQKRHAKKQGMACEQVMLKGRVVAHMLPSLCYASGEGLTQPLTLISRLVLASPAFAQQYLQAHGLEAPILNRSPAAYMCIYDDQCIFCSKVLSSGSASD